MTYRILVDENTSPRVAASLSDEGRDATHITTALDPGVSDQEIIDYAATQGYAVLTHDDDFLRPKHTGAVPILYYSDDTLGVDDLVVRVETVIECVPSQADLPPVTFLDSWQPPDA